jgi:hypothetical protein
MSGNACASRHSEEGRYRPAYGWHCRLGGGSLQRSLFDGTEIFVVGRGLELGFIGLVACGFELRGGITSTTFVVEDRCLELSGVPVASTVAATC